MGVKENDEMPGPGTRFYGDFTCPILYINNILSAAW